MIRAYFTYTDTKGGTYIPTDPQIELFYSHIHIQMGAYFTVDSRNSTFFYPTNNNIFGPISSH